MHQCIIVVTKKERILGKYLYFLNKTQANIYIIHHKLRKKGFVSVYKKCIYNNTNIFFQALCSEV